jgi:hypothetical protein
VRWVAKQDAIAQAAFMTPRPGLKNLDLSLSKSFAITEGKRLQFRAESFNFTNTPAFGQPGTTLNGLGVGQITSAGDPRRIQFGLKFIM